MKRHSPSWLKRMRVVLTVSLFALALVSPHAFAQDEGILSFEEALTLALESPSVDLAESQLELAREQLNVASGLVSAELSAGYTGRFGSQTDETGETESASSGGFNEVSLQATFNVVPFGPYADSVQQAEWALEEAQNALADARADALVEAATRYLEALRDAQEVAVLGAEVEVAATSLEAVRTRLEVEAANDAEVLAAEISLSQAENEQAQLEQDLAQSLALLSQTLGISVNGVSSNVPEATLPEVADTEALLAMRSDVVGAELAVLQAKLEQASAQRDVLPVGSLDLGFSSVSGDGQVQLGAGYNTNSFQPSLNVSYDPSATGVSDGSSFSVGVGVSIPLETSTPAALRAAELSVSQAEEQLEQTFALARLELQGAQNDVEAAQASVQLAGRLVAQSEQAVNNAQERFDLGLVSVLDVQQAESTFLEAQVQATEAESSLVITLMNYARTLSLDPTEVF